MAEHVACLIANALHGAVYLFDERWHSLLICMHHNTSPAVMSTRQLLHHTGPLPGELHLKRGILSDYSKYSKQCPSSKQTAFCMVLFASHGTHVWMPLRASHRIQSRAGSHNNIYKHKRHKVELVRIAQHVQKHVTGPPASLHRITKKKKKTLAKPCDFSLSLSLQQSCVE